MIPVSPAQRNWILKICREKAWHHMKLKQYWIVIGWNLLAETVWELFRLSFLISPDSFWYHTKRNEFKAIEKWSLDSNKVVERWREARRNTERPWKTLRSHCLMEKGHATGLLFRGQLPEIQRIQLNHWGGANDVGMDAMTSNVNGRSKHCEFGYHNVKIDGIINGYPLPGWTHTSHSGLKTLQGRQHQQCEIEVHGITTTLGTGIGQRLFEAALQVGQKTDRKDHHVHQKQDESGELLFSHSTLAEASSDTLEPWKSLFRQSHFCFVSATLLISTMSIGFLRPFPPSLCNNLSAFFYKSIHSSLW